MKTHIAYYPHDKQQLFHNDRYKVHNRAILAGTGTGKTLSGVFEDVAWAIENPNSVIYIFEPTYPMVKRILLPTFESKWIFNGPIEAHPLVIEYNKSDKHMVLKSINGGTSDLWFGSLEEPEMAEGPNVDVIHVDEMRLIRNLELAIQMMERRLRGGGSGGPTGMWTTTTTDNPGSVLYNYYENEETKTPDSKIYRISIDEAPHLTRKYVERMKETHTGGLADRFLYGLFAEAGGSFGFDSTVHVIDSLEEVGAVIKKQGYGQDFGWTNPTATVAIGYDNDDRAYITDEFYGRQVSDEELIAECNTMQGRQGKGTFYCDPSGAQTITKMKRAGLRAQGFQEGMKKKAGKPDEAKREARIRALGSRLKVAGDGRPRFYVLRHCVNTIAELQTYDEKAKQNDHCVDAIMYGLTGMSKKVAWVGR